MNTKELAERNLIYKVKVGSHAYGTALPTSDVDFAGIYIPPVEYYFGLQAFDLLCEQTEEDTSYYSLRKYANLAVAGNPNVLELLFVDPTDIYLSARPANELRVHRHLFLSQRCQKTFVGYAKAQLHRIRNHTKWLSQEIADMAIMEPLLLQGKLSKEWVSWRFGNNMLTRAEKVSGQWTQDSLMYNQQEILDLFKGSNIIAPMKDDERFYKIHDDPLCTDFNGTPFKTRTFQEHLYNEARKKREQYITWMAERNPIRHETEIKFGYDTKHAMHLVRLLRSGFEILTTGNLTVRRPDAQELLDIRAGKWTYEEVTKYADEMVEKIDRLRSDDFRVPPLPDTLRINKMVVEITRDYLEGSTGEIQ